MYLLLKLYYFHILQTDKYTHFQEYTIFANICTLSQGRSSVTPTEDCNGFRIYLPSTAGVSFLVAIY